MNIKFYPLDTFIWVWVCTPALVAVWVLPSCLKGLLAVNLTGVLLLKSSYMVASFAVSNEGLFTEFTWVLSFLSEVLLWEYYVCNFQLKSKKPNIGKLDESVAANSNWHTLPFLYLQSFCTCFWSGDTKPCYST